MTLSDYLRATGQTHHTFANRVGVHPVTVSKWCSGAQRPGWAKMVAISAETGGAVTPDDFMAETPSDGGSSVASLPPTCAAGQ